MDQETLRNFWRSAPEGRLCPWEQAKALGLREASKVVHNGKANLPWIAERVNKVGGGHPGASALFQFFQLVDADKDWFPGKHTGAKRGPKPLLTAAKRRRIALGPERLGKHTGAPSRGVSRTGKLLLTRRVWRDTSPAGDEEQQRRPSVGLAWSGQRHNVRCQAS